MKKFISIFCSVCLITMVSSNAALAHKEHAQQDINQQLNKLALIILTATQNKNYKPLVSELMPLNQSQAYFIQKQLNHNLQLKQSIIGFKAGLTSSNGQKKFNLDTPLYGALFSSKTIQEKSVFTFKNYKKLMLEIEIGYLINKDIDAFTQLTQQDLMALIDKVVPVIELPDLAYLDITKVTGMDLIATNVASNEVLIGDFELPKDFNLLNKMQTHMTRESNQHVTKLISGSGADASGDQAQALFWLIKQLLNSGYSLKKGQLLITGALGKMVPAKPGKHLATFAPYGQISFSVK